MLSPFPQNKISFYQHVKPSQDDELFVGFKKIWAGERQTAAELHINEIYSVCPPKAPLIDVVVVVGYTCFIIGILKHSCIARSTR